MAKNKGNKKGDKSDNKKGGKEKVKVAPEEAVSLKKCRHKHHAPPEQYQPKLVKESIQDDPMVLWNGWSGPVEVAGMRFRVTKNKKLEGKDPFNVINVLAAPQGTELYGLGGSDIYVSVAQVHLPEFRSRLDEGSAKWLAQKRIWEFLHGVFVANGIKTMPQPKPTAASKPVHTDHPEKKMNTSASIEDFILGVLGNYCFDGDSSRAVFRVKLIQDKFDLTKKMLVVEIVSVETGHPIHKYSRQGTFVFHKTLAFGKIPNFKGTRAGDCQKMWEFLTDIIAEHRGTRTAAIAGQSVPRTPNVSYEGHA